MRILHVLRSMASREATRIDLALARGIYLISALSLLIPALWAANTYPQFTALFGWPSVPALLIPSLLLLFILAGRLGGDAIGDLGSGLLDLIFVTGLKPRQWLVVRVVQMWGGFLSVWGVRLPLLVCLFAFGGIRFEQIFVYECLLLSTYLFLSGISLLGSFKTKSRQQLWSHLMLPMVGLEFLLHLPTIALQQATSYFGWSTPMALSSFLDQMAVTSLGSRFKAALTGPIELGDCIPTLILYAILSALALLRFQFRLTAASRGLVDAPAVDRSKEAEYRPGPQRPSRRCWDDALAWQAFCIHGYGKRLVQLKCIFYAMLVVGLLITIPLGEAYLGPVFGISSTVCVIVMLIAVGKPSDCLSREIRDETMPTLLLTPNSADDFYKGWCRGSWHLLWPEVVLSLFLALAGYFLNPLVPSILAGLVLGILNGGPFMMLSPLVPVTFKGVATGLGLTFVFVVIVGICLALGAATHPGFVPLALIPLAYCFNRFVRRYVLPYWMERKISTIV